MKVAKIAITLGIVAATAQADPAEILEVSARNNGETWAFSVTVLHPDTGWDHYADGWEVRTADGTVLGYRKLLHPHETEQPFTRSLTGVVIPAELETVQIVAHCSVDGWTGAPFEVDLRAAP